jgi:hypothetical protein
VSEAIADKLSANNAKTKPWMKSFGMLRATRKESARINRIIEEEFESIDAADWQ